MKPLFLLTLAVLAACASSQPVPSTHRTTAPTAYLAAQTAPRNQGGPVVIERIDAPAGPPERMSLGVQFGQRRLSDEQGYGSLDDPFGLGVDLTLRPDSGPLALEIGTQFGGRTTAGVDLATAELFVGGRLWLLPGERWMPFVSAGGTLMNGELSQNSIRTDESSPGFYFRGGLYWRASEFLSLGGEYRWVLGTDFDMEFAGLGGQGSDLDYGQWSIGFLFHF